MNWAAVQGLLRSLAVAREALRGQPVRRTRDRALLEQRILPLYAGRPEIRRVLFVGCARYTQHYARFFEHVEYWTLDAVAQNRRWGARRHIRDRVERVDRHVPPGYFDLVVCNGVLGWGLNRREDAEAAFTACRRVLRVGGELVVGWNDIFPRNAVRPESLVALRRYERIEIRGLGGPVLRLDVPHRHVFEFYRAGAEDGGQGRSVVGASGAGAHADSGLQAPSMHSS